MATERLRLLSALLIHRPPVVMSCLVVSRGRLFPPGRLCEEALQARQVVGASEVMSELPQLEPPLLFHAASQHTSAQFNFHADPCSSYGCCCLVNATRWATSQATYASTSFRVRVAASSASLRPKTSRRAFYRGISRTVGLLQRRLCSAYICPHSRCHKLAVRTISRVEPLKASHDFYLRQINLRAASGAATSASGALESASALRRSSDATSVSSRGAERMQMVDFLLTKACKVCLP